MERKKYLVVTAGGTGTRMGTAVPKQFLTLDGVPILRRSIEAFLRAVPDIQVITVLPEAHIGYWRQYCLKENFICPQRLVKGGFTRFHSVKNALKYVPENAIVAVHDGVRPLITPEKIKELFSMAEKAPAVIPVMPVTEIHYFLVRINLLRKNIISVIKIWWSKRKALLKIVVKRREVMSCGG